MNDAARTLACVAGAQHAGLRLDAFLAAQWPDLSRSRIQSLIRAGLVQIGHGPARARSPVQAGMTVRLEIPPAQPARPQPQTIPLQIIYEDEDLLVLDKPPALTVHPAAGCADGTLVNALLHHCPDLPGINGVQRPGIVHRLDKDTSGVMVVAKTERALLDLAAQFSGRQIEKQYMALVRGVPQRERDRIETRLGRDPRNRKKMAVHPPAPEGASRSRAAVTHYEIAQRFGTLCALLQLRIETGRTHQIRVHLAHIGHPILGDATYGGSAVSRLALPRDRSPRNHTQAPTRHGPNGTAQNERLLLSAADLPRQMLHARSLAFRHPAQGIRMNFEAPLANDMAATLRILREFFA